MAEKAKVLDNGKELPPERRAKPDLTRNMLSRSAKKDHLAEAYKITGERAEKILDELYGPKSERFIDELYGPKAEK